jgi:hypothetical protein
LTLVEGPTGGAGNPCDRAGTELFESFTDLQGPDAACSCACEAAEDLECGATVVTFHSGSCITVGSTEMIGPNCVSVYHPMGTTVDAEPVPVADGSCAPVPNVQIPAAGFATRVRGCALDDTAGCAAGDTCAPDLGACIAQEGDVPCPIGTGYSERRVLHRDLDDSRGCETCSCGAPTGTCVGAVLSFSTAAGCSGMSAGTIPTTATCDTLVDDAVSARIIGGTPMGSCEPAAVAPTGTVVGTQPVTVCCTAVGP